MGANGFVAVAVLSTDRKGAVVPWLVGYPTQNVLRAAVGESKVQKHEGAVYALANGGEWKEAVISKTEDGKLLNLEATKDITDEGARLFLARQTKSW